MKLFGTKNIYPYKGKPFEVLEFLWYIRFDIFPICGGSLSSAFARHVKSDPPVPDEKSDPVRARPSLRAHFCGCVCVGKRSGERFSTKGRAVRRVSQGNEKTRSTNFLNAFGWSIDVDFEWAGTRNFTGAQPALEGRPRGRSNSWLS